MTGNRSPIPADAMKRCPACERPRGTVRKGWHPISRDGQTLGYTCPDCPRWEEPIRRKVLKNGTVRFHAVAAIRKDRKQLQRARRFERLDEARAWVVETRDGLRGASDWTDPATMTVRDVCERWLEHRRQEVATGGLREVTVNGYASALHPLLLQLGDTPAREATAGTIEKALRTMATSGGQRKRALSHRSLGYALGSLRQAFAYAERECWLTSNPATAARVPSTQRRATTEERVKRWTPAQLGTFRDQLDHYADGRPFACEPWLQVGMLLTLSGLRRSEVLGLDWSAVDMVSGAVEVKASRVKTGRKSETVLGLPKTDNSYRTVLAGEIHDGFTQALKVLWMHQGRPEAGLIIVDPLGPLHPDRFSRAFNRVCDEAGVPRLTRVHNVRHSIALGLQSAGVPDHEAAALLGHDVHTYRRFYLVTDDDGAAGAARSARGLFAAI